MNKSLIEKGEKVIAVLHELYPNPKPALDFSTPFELLIATILSAQCTDARVNIVTKELFAKYKSPQDYVDAISEELEKDIFSTGFYKQKAKSIKNCCIALIELHNGSVPDDFDKLTTLAGVGRKTASVLYGNAFGHPAIAVDTHVKRLSNLIGFVKVQDPEKIEFELKQIFDSKDWTSLSHLLALHGRNICFAKKPKCSECKIADYCDSFTKTL